VAVEHITLGNVMYVALLLAILMLGRWLGRGEGEKPAVSPLVPLPSRRLMTTAVPAILLLALAGFVARIQASESADATLDGWPLATGRWQGPLPPATTWVPRFAASHNERRAAYSSTLGVVEIYSNLYQFQAKGRELIQYENNIVAPEEWVRPWGFSSETIAGRSGDLGAFQMVGPGGREWIVAYTYRVGERLYNRDYAAKLAYGWYSLLGGTPSGVVAMAAACNPGNCDHARALVADFWDDMHPPLLAMLHTTE
jgi:EpsI family protein